MFWFWLIFLLISTGSLIRFKSEAKEDAKAWNTVNKEETEKVLMVVRFTVSLVLTVIGILGILGFISIK